MKRYEALWYTDQDCNNYETREFSSLKAMDNWAIKNRDIGYHFWYTKRDQDWYVLENYGFGLTGHLERISL